MSESIAQRNMPMHTDRREPIGCNGAVILVRVKVMLSGTELDE